QAVTFTAAVSGAGGTPTGTVSFYDGGTLLGTAGVLNGIATYTVSYLPAGDHLIHVVYSGDAAYAGSTSDPLTQTVQQLATSTTLSSSADPSTPWQAVTFTAVVSGAG